MNCLENLRTFMTFDTSMEYADIESRFEQISKILFEKFAVQKGEASYQFKEIEFYFYNKHHRDVITHPRASKPLCWYVNDFGGIDLNFDSSIGSVSRLNSKGKITKKYVLDDHACFGGILIRQLISVDESNVLSGPLACAELFRCNDATGQDRDLPILIEHDNGKVDYIHEPRINLLSSKKTVKSKVDYILGEYNNHPDNVELYKDFASFVDKRYRYVRCDMLKHDKVTNNF